MATHDEIRQIAAKLPGAHEGDENFALCVTVKGKEKGFVWTWNERVLPKTKKIPNENVLAVRVRNLTEKEMILGSDSKKFFTEEHYNGFPAVLVRIKEISADELEYLIIEAWKTKAPKDWIAQFEASLSDVG
jgi:hypothetical protein